MEQDNVIEMERQAIPSFINMPRETLETLAANWNLTMTTRDLCYCQNQYRMRERRDPSIEELRLLDALYVKRTGRIEAYGLRSFYTSDPVVAETYADMVARANRVRREERPYTPLELSGVLTKSLLQAGKKVSAPTLRVGQNAPLNALKNGYLESGCALLDHTPAIVAQKIEGLSAQVRQSLPTDHIILLTPAGLSASEFALRVANLPLPAHTQIIPIDRGGLFEALLRFDGIYLVQNYLPGMDENTSLDALVDAYTDGILLRVDGDEALRIRDLAAEEGLVASIIGKCTANQFLTIRREGYPPVQWETAFLRAFSPVIPIDVEIPHVSTPNDIHLNAPQSQAIVSGGNCVLFAAERPNTPYTICNGHLLAGAGSYNTESIFLSSLFTTIHAVNRAVAAGADYEALTLSNHLRIPALSPSPNLATGELMSALLGVYRAQSELALPDVGGCICADKESTHPTMTVFAATVAPSNPVPHTFTSAGNNVYLLTPLTAENGLLNFDDYRKLLRYVHQLCDNGIIRSAIAVDCGGALAALRTMTQNGYGFLGDKAIAPVTCGFLIETSEIIQGTLLGVTTATPTICIGSDEEYIVSYRPLHVPADRIPMSDIGVAKPHLCVAHTPALGTVLPLVELCKRHNAVLSAPKIKSLRSRAEMTELANTMRMANVAVLVGTTAELEEMQSHPRVANATKELLDKGGLILCLHTDMKAARNAPIPTDHPFFYNITAIRYERCAIRCEGENGQIVHMRSLSEAIPDMLAAAIAYFQ